jgi:hypothetical protein
MIHRDIHDLAFRDALSTTFRASMAGPVHAQCTGESYGEEPTMSKTDNSRKTRSAICLVLMGLGLAFSTGCTTVAPYERAKLAHPTMAANELAGPGEEHLRAVTEGAIGGSAGAGSGCGCN